MTPKVSIAIISHRKDTQAQRFLALAIDSVFRQTYKNYQLLVHHDEENRGILKANETLKSAIGDYRLLLAYDDELEPTALEKMVDAALDTKAGVVYTDRIVSGGMDLLLESGSWEEASFVNTYKSPIPASYLISDRCWSLLGGYRVIPYADWDFPVRAFYTGVKGYHIKEPLFLYRCHRGQTTAIQDHTKDLIEFFRFNEILAKQLNPDTIKDPAEATVIRDVVHALYGAGK